MGSKLSFYKLKKCPPRGLCRRSKLHLANPLIVNKISHFSCRGIDILMHIRRLEFCSADLQSRLYFLRQVSGNEGDLLHCTGAFWSTCTPLFLFAFHCYLHSVYNNTMASAICKCQSPVLVPAPGCWLPFVGGKRLSDYRDLQEVLHHLRLSINNGESSLVFESGRTCLDVPTFPTPLLSIFP